MKAKVYIPIIIGAGAAAGVILGVVNFKPQKVENDQNQSVIAQETTTSETTLSEEEKKKLEEQKQQEYEEKEKKEEQNASDKLKKKEEEKKKKKEEEEKKKEEEEAKKKEEEEKKKKEEATEESGQSNENTGDSERKPSADDEYEYIYVPVNNNPENNTQNNPAPITTAAPAATVHEHDWKKVTRTVHHDAVTHIEKKYAGTAEYTECRRYGELIFTVTTDYGVSDFYQVCKTTDGRVIYQTYSESEKQERGYFMSLLNIPSDDSSYVFSTDAKELTKDVTVPDKEAYDEEVIDHYVCSTCGQTWRG